MELLQLYRMDIQLLKDLLKLIHELSIRNNNPNGAIKIIVTGGYSDTLESVTGEANLYILFINWRKPSAETYDKGVNLISDSFQRPYPEIKTLNYFNTLRLRKKMQEFHAVDVLFHTDTISEASRANVFLVKGKQIYTPEHNILKGITRKQVLSMLPEIQVDDIPFDTLFDFDEMFITSTTRDVTPVISVDGKKIGTGKPGNITREAQDIFNKKGY